ncbi:MAG: hypothetical protein M3Z35_00845 [Nitrospirota bacterium]|nr:hypothetical protein [Nitrospirota bacterium]
MTENCCAGSTNGRTKAWKNGWTPRRTCTMSPIGWAVRLWSAPRAERNLRILQCLAISPDESVLHDTFGYGIKTSDHADRLILVWQAHTEYYSYQVWHIPSDKTTPLSFGPLTFPNYVFPVSCLGLQVNALDLLITKAPQPALKRSGISCRGPPFTAVGSSATTWP